MKLTAHQCIALKRVDPRIDHSEGDHMIAVTLGDLTAFVNEDGFFKLSPHTWAISSEDKATLLRAMADLGFREWGDEAVAAGIGRMLARHGARRGQEC